MAARVRQSGTIVCAAKYPEMEGDLYLDDLIQSLLIGLGITATEDGGGVWTVADPREWNTTPPQTVQILQEKSAELSKVWDVIQARGNLAADEVIAQIAHIITQECPRCIQSKPKDSLFVCQDCSDEVCAECFDSPLCKECS